MDLLAGSVPLDTHTHLTAVKALEALLRHDPIQRCRAGHDAVLWFSPSLQWWCRYEDRGWVHGTESSVLRGMVGYPECCSALHAWWYTSGNDEYEWDLYKGSTP